MAQNKVITISIYLSKIIIFSLFLSVSTVQADAIPSSEGVALLMKIATQQATRLQQQANQLMAKGQYDQAKQLYQQGLTILEKYFPPESPVMQRYLYQTADVYRMAIANNHLNRNDYLEPHKILDNSAEANRQEEQHWRESLAILHEGEQLINKGLEALDNTDAYKNPTSIDESASNFRFQHYSVLQTIYQTESTLYATRGARLYYAKQYESAEELLNKAVASANNRESACKNIVLNSQELQKKFPTTADSVIANTLKEEDCRDSKISALFNLVDLYQYQTRYSEIETLMQELDKILSDSTDSSQFIRMAANWNWIDDYDKAEIYYKKALQVLMENPVANKSHGIDLNQLVKWSSLDGLGVLYQNKYQVAKMQGDTENTRKYYTKAEESYLKILKFSPNTAEINEVSTAGAYDSLGVLYLENSEYQKANDYFVKSLAIREKRLNEKNNYTNQQALTWTRHRVAITYRHLGNKTAAERLYRLNLGNPNNRLPPSEEGSKAVSLSALAVLKALGGDTQQGLNYARQALQVYDEQDTGDFLSLSHRPLVDLSYLWVVERSLNNQQLTQLAAANEALPIVQHIHGDKRMQVLLPVALRLANHDPAVQEKVRELFQTKTNLKTLTNNYYGYLASPDIAIQAKVEQLATEQKQLRQNILTLDSYLRQVFPAYNRLIDPKPLAMAQVQKLLKPDEALLTWVIGNGVTQPVGMQSYLLVIRPERAKLIPLPTNYLNLRQLLNDHLSALTLRDEKLALIPVNLSGAHELYQSLLEPAEQELVGVKHIIAVPDDTLKALPLQTLLKSASPAANPVAPNNDDYASADWLLNHYAISYLPAVHSLAQLRERDVQPVTSAATERVPFMGFGDPVLQGKKPADRELLVSIGRSLNRGEDSTFATDTSKLRELEALPNTGSELEYAAELFGADSDTSLYLANKATETNLKGLSDQDTLAKADILAFATHAFGVNDDLSIMPGLVLTPPKVGTAQDDGYLNVEEIPNLKLNAQWVVLAACETAKYAQQDVGQGLSQLVKAFFIAGTRSVLATHWSVNDTAAHELMNTLFKSLAEQPDLSRAEALRRAMQSVATQCNWRCTLGEWLGLAEQRHTAHPTYWGAFVIYGEGIQ